MDILLKKPGSVSHIGGNTSFGEKGTMRIPINQPPTRLLQQTYCEHPYFVPHGYILYSTPLDAGSVRKSPGVH